MTSSSWDDKHDEHDQLVKYCKENGKTIGFVYSKLIRMFLENPKIIE